MQLAALRIVNFKSLHDISLKELGSINLFVGKNGSGKSNLFESISLFFDGLSLQEAEIGTLNQYLWHRGDSKDDIQFQFTLRGEPSEFAARHIDFFRRTGIPAPQTLLLSRSISASGNSMKWLPLHISVNDLELVPLSMELVIRIVSTRRNVDEKEIRDNIADFSKWVVQSLKEKFKTIQAVRDRVPAAPTFSDRETLLDEKTLNSIVDLGQSVNSDKRRTYERIRKQFETFSEGKRVDTTGNRLFVTEEGSDFSIPLSYTGGGTQEALLLSRLIHESPAPMIAIEEPETHLHPELVKKLFKDFTSLVKGRDPKQLLISSHSPFLLDRTAIENLWMVRLEGLESHFIKVVDLGGVRDAFGELGVKPSDLLFADGVLIVEGESEEVLFPSMTRLVSEDYQRRGLVTVPASGKTKARHHLEMWSKIAKNAQIPLFIILDSDARNEIDDAKRKKYVAPENAFLLSRSCIEAYYPAGKLHQALNELFPLKLSLSEVEKILQTATPAKELDERMTKKRIWNWKVQLARWWSDHMESEDIPDEIRGILKAILERLK